MKLDNVKMETVLTEFEYGELPTVTNKPDSETLDFEDRNVGSNLPERIEGDAEIGAELTDTNRYLMISDTDKQNSKTVTITPYGTAEGATHVIFEFDIEYLKSSLKALHDFYLVDDSGKEIHFAELYGYSYSGPAPHIRMYRQIEGKNEFTMMDSAPNVVDRAFYLKGERAGASCTSNTKVQFVVDLESGDVTVTYRMNYSYVYKALTTSVKALKIVSTEAGVSVLTIDNLSAKYVDASAVLDPTPEDFEGNYKSEEISWECTHSDALGLPSSATNLHFDSGISVTYPTGSYTNVHGAIAQVLEENGNKYLNMTAPKRINGRDRAHGLSLSVEKCSYSPNAYVYETDLKLDSVLADGSESQKAYLQIVVRSQTGTYVQYNMTGSVAGKVDLVGLALADWDEWFTLRLEYYPEQEKMQVYVKIGNGSFEYRGDLDRATTSSSAKEGDFSPAVLKGNIASIDISGANDASKGFSFNVDNASLCSTVLEYNGEQTPIVPEGGNTAPDNPGEGGGTNPPVDPPVNPPVVPPVITPDPIIPDVKDPEFDIDDSLLEYNEGITDEENFDEWTN